MKQILILVTLMLLPGIGPKTGTAIASGVEVLQAVDSEEAVFDLERWAVRKFKRDNPDLCRRARKRGVRKIRAHLEQFDITKAGMRAFLIDLADKVRKTCRF